MKKQISLAVKCPYCMKSLLDEDVLIQGHPSIKLNILTEFERGTIHLCAVYECYENISDVEIKKGEIVEFTCPHCNKELLVKEECKLCDAPMVSLMMNTGGRVSLCSRNGCPNHYIAFEDLSIELHKFYEQYGD
jgi:DNA-directed RNA polymerase subunit RPC12/RpoP